MPGPEPRLLPSTCSRWALTPREASTAEHQQHGGREAHLLNPTVILISIKDGDGASVHVQAPLSPRGGTLSPLQDLCAASE